MNSDYNNLCEEEKRLYRRDLTKKGNYSLNHTAAAAGVKNFAKFHNAGYKGLYNEKIKNDNIMGEENANELTIRLGKLLEKQLKKQVVLCLKICQSQIKV